MIIHLDADAFFASVEQAADPRLRRRPIAVGGSRRGVIASASYEARKVGIKTAMPTAHAKKLCPSLIVVPGDFEKYERFSQLMFSYAYDHTPLVEVTSIDEGYFDVGGNRTSRPVDVAERIRKAITQSLKIPVSEGVGSNKLVSAVASKLRKPQAFVEVPVGEEQAFLGPLSNRWLPGVGDDLGATLDQAGLIQIRQIAAISPAQLALFAGKRARQLYEFAHGHDDRPVVPEAPAAKSFSAQETFESDSIDEEWILAKLRQLADGLICKVRSEGRSFRTVEVRLRYNDFDETRRSESLNEPTDLEQEVYPLLARLLCKAWERRVSIRLVGVKFSNLYDGLFQAGLPLLDAGRDTAQMRRLAHVVDDLKARYGRGALMRGHDLLLREDGDAERKGKSRPTVSGSVRGPGVRPEDWVPLNVKSGYSFLNSLLTPQQIVDQAVARGHRAVAICDPNLHGAVEFFQAANHAGIHPVLGAELSVAGERVCAYVQNTEGYRNLCHLLSLERIGASDLEEARGGLLLRPAEHQMAIRYTQAADREMHRLLAAIRSLDLVAPEADQTQAAGCHWGAATPRDGAQARESLEIVERCEFAFEFGKLQFPQFETPDGSHPRAFLKRLTLEGMHRRYGASPSPSVCRQIEEELQIVAEVGYEDYFLLTWDLLWNHCHPAGIDWITRGSAADSLICYCLGISDVCPIRFELYFKRFLNKERMALNKLPDIDLDFAHDRKDDVVDLIFRKYGKQAAVVGGFNTFRGRSAFADIAKALGVSENQIRRMTEHMPWSRARDLEAAVAESVECKDEPWHEEPFRTALALAERLDGMPRHPKMHPCGLVLSRGPIAHLTPLFQSNKGYPTAHFDMESVEALGLVKMDILAQGGLAVIRDTRRSIREREGSAPDVKKLAPWRDEEIWKLIRSGGARGVHHIESPAMLSLSKMVGPKTIDDLIAIVSVIRPGAANNMKKEQFARRAQGLDPVEYPHPSLEPCLRSTYGVVAYEEHILQICEAFAGLPAGRADVLRRALVKGRQETIREIGKEFGEAARERGRTEEDIHAVWELVTGFQGYAFCRAHSTAYGVEAYEAAHLKRYYPVDFLAAVLSHGKGFYNRLVYSIECRRLGIGFLPPDVNASTDLFQPEKGAIRIPLRCVKHLTHRTLRRWAEGKPFASMADFYRRVQPEREEMEALIKVGAFDAFGLSSTRQFWAFREMSQWDHVDRNPLGQALFEVVSEDTTRRDDHQEVALAEPSLLDRIRAEQDLLGFPVSGHPLALFQDVQWESYCPIKRLMEFSGQTVTVAGLIIEDRLHRQVDGRMMKFLSLCDPTGILDCELFANAYKRFGIQTVRHPVVAVTGRVQPFVGGYGFSLVVQNIQSTLRTRKYRP